MGFGSSFKKAISSVGSSVSSAWKDWGKDSLAVAMPIFYTANGGRAYDAKKGRADGSGAVGGAISPYARSYAAIDGAKGPPDPTMPEMPANADPSAPDASARALRRRQRMLAARGRSSTILTGPLGLTDAGSMGAPKTLLGT